MKRTVLSVAWGTPTAKSFRSFTIIGSGGYSRRTERDPIENEGVSLLLAGLGLRAHAQHGGRSTRRVVANGVPAPVQRWELALPEGKKEARVVELTPDPVEDDDGGDYQDESDEEY